MLSHKNISIEISKYTMREAIKTRFSQMNSLGIETFIKSPSQPVCLPRLTRNGCTAWYGPTTYPTYLSTCTAYHLTFWYSGIPLSFGLRCGLHQSVTDGPVAVRDITPSPHQTSKSFKMVHLILAVAVSEMKSILSLTRRRTCNL